MDIEKESNREAFEKAFAQTEFYRNKADLYSLLADIDDETFDFFRKNGFGDYSIGEAQAAWSAWQAAEAQSVLELTDKMIVAIESEVESQLKASAIDADPFRLDGEKIWYAALEAQEPANDN